VLGSTISHYKILDKIGEGGMGEVYLAEDTELERKVALKFLPAHVSRDAEALERFKREAKATAALQHPNIVTIHEIGEHEGRHFIVMAYVEGDLLSDLIARRELSIERAMQATIELCDGLGEAHAAGIVHRDLKPDNILIDKKGHPRVLDFGLAVQSGATRLTQEGSTAGTLHYMSPEQSRGDAIDQRTDIFSLGAILYEMITGQRAFDGDHAAAIQYKIASEEPQPLARFNNKATPELQRIVTKAIEKNAEVRYQTVSGLGAALKPLTNPSLSTTSLGTVHHGTKPGGRRAVWAVIALAALAIGYKTLAPRFSSDTAPPASGSLSSIGVLLLKNSSNDPDQAYLADGVTEALNNELGKVSALNVVSRYSITHCQEANMSLDQMARELGADVFVDGSVLPAGDRVRINVELIRADTGERIWGDSYESDMGDVLLLQSDVARAITGQIKVSLEPYEEERLSRTRSVDPEALRAYFKGRYYQNLITYDGLLKAMESYELATTRDPEFALPHVGLANMKMVMAYFGVDVEASWNQALQSAEKALALDPTLEEAHSKLAYIKMFYEWDWKAAAVLLEKARELNPNAADVRTTYASLLMLTGDMDEGVNEHRSAVAASPLNHGVSCAMSRKLYLARRYDDAIDNGHRTATDFPTCPFELLAAGEALIAKELYDDAITQLNASMAIEPTSRAEARIATAHAQAGRITEAEALVSKLRREDSPQHYYIAIALTAMGRYDEAFEALNSALDQKSPHVPWLVNEPGFDPIRNDPRFDALVARLGLTSSHG
jgi:serine/threonine protein kinase/Flp pilus assembly protein TadD